MNFKDIDIHQFGHTIQITGMLLDGQDGATYFVRFPDEKQRATAINELTMTVEDWEKFLYQSDVLETAVSYPKKAVVRKSQRQIDQNIAWAVFRRDGYQCRYCGRNDVPLTVDHIILWEHGGPSVEINLLSACKPCNRIRGRMEYKQWLESSEYQERSVLLPSVMKENNLSLIPILPQLETWKQKTQRSR